MELNLNFEHPFPRLSGYKKVSVIMGVDITDFRLYLILRSIGREVPKLLQQSLAV